MRNHILNVFLKRIENAVIEDFTLKRGVKSHSDIFSQRVPNGIAINIRVPFCRSICAFCALPGEVYREELKNFFLEGVKRELEIYSKLFDSYAGKIPVVRRVYFSGGTPSLLHRELRDIIGFVKDNFEFSGNIAIEAHPSDLKGSDVLNSLINSGITQVSIGVQSFSNESLSHIGRAPSQEPVQEVVKRVLSSGFDYVNIDLVFGPSDPKALVRDLEVATELGVDGISTYPIMILPYSKIKATSADNPPIEEGKISEMYSLILDYMERASYKVRAIWSFSRHPEKYVGPYEYENFLGVGPGAWGLCGGVFTLNVRSLEDYLGYLYGGELPINGMVILKRPARVQALRSLYHAKIDMSLLKSLDLNTRFFLNTLRVLGLLSREGDSLKLTRKGLIYGNIVTKRIAERLLTRINDMLVK